MVKVVLVAVLRETDTEGFKCFSNQLGAHSEEVYCSRKVVFELDVDLVATFVMAFMITYSNRLVLHLELIIIHCQTRFSGFGDSIGGRIASNYASYGFLKN